jgi:hypothetical protein
VYGATQDSDIMTWHVYGATQDSGILTWHVLRVAKFGMLFCARII